MMNVTKTSQIFAVMIVMIFTSLGCKKSKYEFVGDQEPEVELENPQPLDDEEKPKPNGPHEFYGDNGFWIKVNPGELPLGDQANFTGQCGPDNTGKLTWDFGDGRSGAGTKVSHTYKDAGTFKIEGLCIEEDGQEQKGVIQITIIAPKIDEPANPGQNPSQSPNQSSPCRNSYYYSCG